MRTILTLILVVIGARADCIVDPYFTAHKKLRGFLIPTAQVNNGSPQTTWHITIDQGPGETTVRGTLRCRSHGVVPCPGRTGELTSVSLAPRGSVPREAFLWNFDATVGFLIEGHVCHLEGTTPFISGRELDVITGSYACTTRDGSVVQTGTFGAVRAGR